jgi:O-antigen/teichoic acid export membrane protein
MRQIAARLNVFKALEKPSVRGAAWTIAGFGASQMLRFGGNLILTRLLVPEFFGIMAIVNGLRMGLDLLSDIGITQSIIQNPNATKTDFLNTAWTLQIVRGLFIAAFIMLMAWPVSNFYEEPLLFPVILITGGAAIIRSLTSTKLWLLNRSLKLGWFTTLELGSNFLGLCAMIIWAWFDPSIWALAFGTVVTPVVKAATSHLLIPGPNNRLCWNRDYLNEIVSFGRWIMVSTATIFFAEQADRFILAKLLSFSVLGVYTIAITLAQLPQKIMKQLNSRVIFPVVSQNADMPRSDLRLKILSRRKSIVFPSAIGVAILSSFGDLLISTLYDDRYLDATWMFSLLCLGIWFSMLFYTSIPCLLGVGKPLYTAQGNFMRFLMVVIGIPIGFNLGGEFGAIFAVAISDFPAYLGIQYGMWRERLVFWKQDFLATALMVVCFSLLIAVRLSLGMGTPFDLLLT